MTFLRWPLPRAVVPAVAASSRAEGIAFPPQAGVGDGEVHRGGRSRNKTA